MSDQSAIVSRARDSKAACLSHGATFVRALLRAAFALLTGLVPGALLGLLACDPQPRPWVLQAPPECTRFGQCIETCLDSEVPDEQVFRVEWCAARCMPEECVPITWSCQYAPSDFNISLNAGLTDSEKVDRCVGLGAAVHYERVNCIDYPVAMCTDGCRVP